MRLDKLIIGETAIVSQKEKIIKVLRFLQENKIKKESRSDTFFRLLKQEQLVLLNEENQKIPAENLDQLVNGAKVSVLKQLQACWYVTYFSDQQQAAVRNNFCLLGTESHFKWASYLDSQTLLALAENIEYLETEEQYKLVQEVLSVDDIKKLGSDIQYLKTAEDFASFKLATE